MLDFWKTIITTLIPHLLGWPVASVVLGLIFKNQVSTLLTRLKNFSAKHGSTSLDIETLEAAGQKIEKVDVTAAGSLSASAADVTIAASATAGAVVDATEPVDEAARRAMVEFGKGIDVVQAREVDIRAHLARMHFDFNTTETTDILIRNLAYNQAIAVAERTYRLIFGSQLLLLKFLNVGGQPKTDSEMRPFYERAKKKNPKFYGSYSYEDWRKFLLDQSLITRDQGHDAYWISASGRAFLTWLTSQGLNEEKAG